MPEQPIILTRGWHVTCIILQVLPVPGTGAIIAGIKNPHTKLLGRGIAQMALVVFGSWPLILPGAAGLIWAVFDAYRIARHTAPPAAWSRPTPDAEPSTLDRRREAQQEARAARRAAKQAEKAAKQAEKAARAAERSTTERD